MNWPPEALLVRFQVVSLLGPGASVWRVRVGDVTAILKAAPAGTTAARRLQAEGARMVELPPHPNLPRLLERGEDGEAVYLLIEDVGDEDLDVRWRRSPPALTEILAVAEGVSAALAHLHAHGVVHLDVTEGNIVAAEGRFVLVDLGIGAPLGPRRRVTVDGSGTEGRRAPEVAHPTRRADGAADVYVLGLVLAEALLGGRAAAWPADEEGQLRASGLMRHRMADRRLVRLITGSLALAPGRRPSSAQVHREVLALRGDVGQWPRVPVRRGAAGVAVVVGIAVAAAGTYRVVHAPTLVVRAGALAPGPAGYLGIPFFLDPSTIGLLRHQPMWATSAPAGTLDTELKLRLEPAPAWEAIPALPGGAIHAQVGDLDGDGHPDPVVHELPPTGGERHRVLWGPRWEENAARYPVNPGGRPLMMPHPSGRPTLVVGADEHRLRTYRWSGAALTEEILTETVFPSAWLDVDEGGTWDTLSFDRGELSLTTARGSERLGPAVPMTAWWAGGDDSLAIADLDGDGDEDVLYVDSAQSAVATWTDTGEQLVAAVVEGVTLPRISAQANLGYAPAQLLDLDADGLPELLLPSGGFAPHAGASLAWHNEGGLRFTPFELPWNEAHDGTRLLAADLDRDGRIELLDLSINDALLAVPDHRLWDLEVAGSARFRTLEQPFPLGTVIRSTGEPWIRVVRDAGPVLVPPTAGPLLIRLPDGQEFPEVDAGLIPVLRTDDTAGLAWKARVGDAELRLVHTEAHDELRSGSNTVRTARLTPTWGCPDATGCLFLEGQASGGWRAVIVDPATLGVQALDAFGDMFDSVARSREDAFSSRAGRVQRRDPRTYAAIGEPVEVPGVGHCEGLGVGGGEVACCSRAPGALVILDVETLVQHGSLAVDTGSPCSVVRGDGGWVVSTATGAALVDDAVRAEVRLGAPAAVSAAGEALLLLTEDEAVWARSDLSLIGGVFSPGIATLHPVSAPWAPSASPSKATP